MRVLVAHNAVSGDGSPDEADVLTQVLAVTEALSALGHGSETLAVTLDLESALARIREFSPDVVFNLVESLADTGRLIHLFPHILDATGIPYAGSSAESQMATSHKAAAKRLMEAGGLPTPAWAGPRPHAAFAAPPVSDREASENTWIVKSVWEHASIGLGPESLVKPRDAAGLYARLDLDSPRLGGSCFAERFVPGREFNLSVLSGPEGPEVLPPAEIVFEGYGEDRARIVDYRAKWDEGSYEFHHTPRRFDFSPGDAPLLAGLARLALSAWRLFDLSGWARVDFRVDPEGNPFILEVNANPCLSPDAGFAAALERAGLPFEKAVERILANVSLR